MVVLDENPGGEASEIQVLNIWKFVHFSAIRLDIRELDFLYWI